MHYHMFVREEEMKTKRVITKEEANMTIKSSTFYGVIGPDIYVAGRSFKKIVFRGSATAARRYAKKHGGAEAGYSVVIGGGPVGTPWKGPGEEDLK